VLDILRLQNLSDTSDLGHAKSRGHSEVHSIRMSLSGENADRRCASFEQAVLPLDQGQDTERLPALALSDFGLRVEVPGWLNALYLFGSPFNVR
jgi:hypothetical protein